MRTNLFTRPARLVLVGVLALGAAGVLGACGDLDTPATGGTTATQAQDAKADTKADTKAESKADKAKAALSPEAQQAVRSAESYLDSAGFSKSGLIHQLEFEGFSKADAKAALATMTVDWKDEAAQSAKSYLESQGFSRAGLLHQLEFEGFTKAQAEHGVKAAGL